MNLNVSQQDLINGKTVYQSPSFSITVQQIEHTRRTRYSMDDHLYDIRIHPKQGQQMPFLLNIEPALQTALTYVLELLKQLYPAQNNHQLYVTILDRSLLKGINTGNYSLNTPSQFIVRYVLAQLYNFLKSNQTLVLNQSFKLQVKVLSVRTTNDLVRRRNFRPHIMQ